MLTTARRGNQDLDARVCTILRAVPLHQEKPADPHHLKARLVAVGSVCGGLPGGRPGRPVRGKPQPKLYSAPLVIGHRDTGPAASAQTAGPPGGTTKAFSRPSCYQTPVEISDRIRRPSPPARRIGTQRRTPETKSIVFIGLFPSTRFPQGEKEESHRQSRTIMSGDRQRPHRARRFANDRHRQKMLRPTLFGALDQNLTR